MGQAESGGKVGDRDDFHCRGLRCTWCCKSSYICLTRALRDVGPLHHVQIMTLVAFKLFWFLRCYVIGELLVLF